ncbi:hypothetical protein ACFL1T_04630 [Chlamydiota bacterium]
MKKICTIVIMTLFYLMLLAYCLRAILSDFSLWMIEDDLQDIIEKKVSVNELKVVQIETINHWLDNAIAFQSTNSQLWAYKGLVEYLLGKNEKEHFNRAIALFPYNPFYYLWKSISILKEPVTVENSETILKNLIKAYTLLPLSSVIRFHLGKSFYASGNAKKGLHLLVTSMYDDESLIEGVIAFLWEKKHDFTFIKNILPKTGAAYRAFAAMLAHNGQFDDWIRARSYAEIYDIIEAEVLIKEARAISLENTNDKMHAFKKAYVILKQNKGFLSFSENKELYEEKYHTLFIELIGALIGSFIEKYEYESALRYVHEAYTYGKKEKDFVLIGAFLERIKSIVPRYDAYSNLDSVLLKAKLLIKKEHFSQALSLMEAPLSKYKYDIIKKEVIADLYYWGGLCNEKLGDTEEAIKCYEKSINYSKRNIKSLLRLRFLLNQEQRQRESIVVEKKLIQLVTTHISKHDWRESTNEDAIFAFFTVEGGEYSIRFFFQEIIIPQSFPAVVVYCNDTFQNVFPLGTDRRVYEITKYFKPGRHKISLQFLNFPPEVDSLHCLSVCSEKDVVVKRW